MIPAVVHHFSEDPSIEVFMPHVPRTNPTRAPAVWAIDSEHAPLYWFPRDCPRVTAWPRNDTEASAFRRELNTTAWRVHAIEIGWLDRMRTVRLYRYDFAPEAFESLASASGHWTTAEPVVPVAVTPVGDLLAAHAEAAIELRIVASLWPLHDAAVSEEWDFSMVRMANALPRLTG